MIAIPDEVSEGKGVLLVVSVVVRGRKLARMGPALFPQERQVDVAFRRREARSDLVSKAGSTELALGFGPVLEPT
jgi:hypothetical protein